MTNVAGSTAVHSCEVEDVPGVCDECSSMFVEYEPAKPSVPAYVDVHGCGSGTDVMSLVPGLSIRNVGATCAVDGYTE